VKITSYSCISSVWKTSPMHNNVQLLMTHIYIRLKSKISTIINKHKTKNNDISLLHLVGLYYNRNSPRDYWRICPIHKEAGWGLVEIWIIDIYHRLKIPFYWYGEFMTQSYILKLSIQFQQHVCILLVYIEEVTLHAFIIVKS
jgi:hypothetical protein